MKKFFKKASFGESMVSMTSLGLAIGVMMTVGLLLLIVVKGFESFWPKPIYEISLKQPDANVSIGSKLFGQKVSLKENKSFENNSFNIYKIIVLSFLIASMLSLIIIMFIPDRKN